MKDINIALVGGGDFTVEVLEKTSTQFFDHLNANAKILAVADPDPLSPGIKTARKLGKITVQDYKELYSPHYEISLIIILTSEENILYDILSTKPSHIRVMAYYTFDLFWKSINYEAEKLRKRTQEIEAILDGIQDFIIVITPDMKITEVNEAFLQQMGFAREEVIGKHCYEVFQRMNRRCDYDNGHMVCPLQAVIDKGQSSQSIFPRINQRGEVVYIEVTMYPIWESDGSISRFIEVSRDVTKREKMDEDINRSLEQMVEERTKELKKQHEQIRVQDRMASLGKLSASVVHEINNPLSGILNLVLLIKKITQKGSLDQRTLENFNRYLELMETETRRISRITSNLLSFSRESKMEINAVNVNQILEDTLFLHSNYFKINHIQVEKRFDPQLPDIMADGEQIKQVFMNLSSNAVEAMEPHGGGTLLVETRSNEHQVMVIFEDTGTGISKKNISKLFDPFFSTKSRGKGVGLGLSVAFGIVQQHNGSLDVQSKEGKGTTITLTLPLNQPKLKYE